MGPTQKQLGLLAHLADQLGAGDEWDMFQGMSRRAAQRRATVRDASSAIDAALARISRREALAAKPPAAEGTADVVCAAVYLGGKWRDAKPAVVARLAALLPATRRKVAARWAELRASGTKTPLTTAMDEADDALAVLSSAGRPAEEPEAVEAVEDVGPWSGAR